MSVPVITPRQQSNINVLPPTGSFVNVLPALPYGIYGSSTDFISGAVDQVAFCYKMLGGDVLDLEITENNVYAAYELAVLEYSYIINLHQSKNSLSSFLGSPTGSFNQDGSITSGSMSGSNAALKFPKFSLAYARNVSDAISYEAGIDGGISFYSASLDVINGVQDYDLQKTIVDKANSGNVDFQNALTASNNGQIRVNRVFFRSPHQTWRFFGYYGGLSVVGNMNTYGQYADNSTFDVVPAWQNKLQAINYEINLYTRASHYSYEIKNNKIRLYPAPTSGGPQHIWFIFSFTPNPLSEDANAKQGINGVNNVNTLPFENIPYESINSIGKQWIRRYALAIVKGILGEIRGKFQTLPIPGESVTLNHDSLLSRSTDEMEKLKTELKEILDQLTYSNLIKTDAEIMENNSKIHQQIPRAIFVG